MLFRSMGLPTYPKDARIRYDFAQRGKLSPVTVWWYDGGRRPASEVIPAALTEHLGGKVGDGVLIIGEKGFTFGGCWSGADYIKLNDEEKLSGILNHAASKSIPETLPHSVGHVKEWVEACMGKGKCFSDFGTGGHLTEIALSGVVALRTGKKLQWNGPAMKATNAPEADQYIYAKYRKGWV